MLSVEKQIKRQQMLLESFQGYKILKKEPKKKKKSSLNEPAQMNSSKPFKTRGKERKSNMTCTIWRCQY